MQALKRFQKSRGLPETGKLDAKTQEHLRLAKALSKYAAKGYKALDRYRVKKPYLAAGTKDAAGTKALQTALQDLGFDVSPTGTFDAKTADAVKAFQKTA